MKVAMVQMTVAAGEVEKNRLHAIELIRQAKAADVVVLPEVWTTGYSLRNIEKSAEEPCGPTLSALRQLAQELEITIVAGSMALRMGEKIYNSTVIVEPTGIVGTYHKMHLFSLFGEERFFAAGKKPGLFTVNGIKAGVAICYELRFPELFRTLAVLGAEVIYLPAEWPAVRSAHWKLFIQARAAESQVYLCAVNCVGDHKGQAFYGHSMLVAPNGEVIAEGGDEEEIIYGEIDLAMVAEVRAGLSVLRDRRPEVYL